MVPVESQFAGKGVEGQVVVRDGEVGNIGAQRCFFRRGRIDIEIDVDFRFDVELGCSKTVGNLGRLGLKVWAGAADCFSCEVCLAACANAQSAPAYVRVVEPKLVSLDVK